MYISLSNGRLIVRGEVVLTKVPENVVLSASTGTVAQGVFLGASSSEASNRHVFSLGILRDLRFMCCFRFNLWWMTQRIGQSGRDVPLETQFLLLESRNGDSELRDLNEREDTAKEEPVYIVFLPLLDGSFRASLQGNDQDELQLCLESGSPDVKMTGGNHSMFLLIGNDPFQVIEDVVQAVEAHMQSFRRRVNKKMPGILNYFGWCTWDAFYTDVSPEGLKAGLQSLREGGTPARVVIIDDGWQSVANDGKPDDCIENVTAEEQFSRRLTDIKENQKFRKDKSGDGCPDDSNMTLKSIITGIREEFAVKYVYVWHALTGYWGGVRPDGATKQYESVLKYPKLSPGVAANQVSNVAADYIVEHGLALVPPKKVFSFYNDYHSYLSDSGVDGVKVDVQNIVETLGDGHEGRVSLTRQYHQSLEASISHHFPDNGCIACMCHNNDGLFSGKNTAVVRASDDFYPRDPASHTIHIASVAYNSLFLGEFMQPDWDMFQSLHPAAEYHAAARAIGGCPVYVSDKPGQHDFNVLKKLVLPDGSLLRAQHPGRPTKDCLFSDPARDGKSLLKIWNMNKYTGVVGAFNCQGAGWCRKSKVNAIHDANPPTVTSSIRTDDVNWLWKISPKGWDGECAVYRHREGGLAFLPKGVALPVTLKVLQYEIFTVSPIMKLGPGVAFAPIGLLKMFNSGGAVVDLEWKELQNDAKMEFLERPVDILGFANYKAHRAKASPVATAFVHMKIHGCGEFGMYSSVKPRVCLLETKEIDFTYDTENGLVTICLPASSNLQLQNLVIEL